MYFTIWWQCPIVTRVLFNSNKLILIWIFKLYHDADITKLTLDKMTKLTIQINEDFTLAVFSRNFHQTALKLLKKIDKD